MQLSRLLKNHLTSAIYDIPLMRGELAMQHALCRLEKYLGGVSYASTSAERKRFIENLSELAGRLAALFAKLK